MNDLTFLNLQPIHSRCAHSRLRVIMVSHTTVGPAHDVQYMESCFYLSAQRLVGMMLMPASLEA